MAMVIDRCGEVMLVRLDRGVTNALDLVSVNELAGVIEQAKNDSAVRGLVLASANEKFFSIGFDIPQLYELGREEFRHFFRRFNQTCLEMYTLPKPTVAALTGHAIAGGCILALSCDYRIIGKGRKLMGLNEVKLGVPVPHFADSSLRSLIGVRQARAVMESGEFFEAEAAAKMGMVDQVMPVGEVVEEAIEKARQLGLLPAAAYGMIKRNRVAKVKAEVLAEWEEQEQFFVECWYSEEARVLLQEAMKKF
jgi:enoyl-CoA hydratase/carnithine racemase